MPKHTKDCDRPDTLHNRLIDQACIEGWARPPWKQVLRRKLLEQPWASEADWEAGESEIWSILNEVTCVPDAWRIREESREHGWNYPVLVLEFLEVEVTNHIGDSKLTQYDTLWWRLDASGMFHLRVFRMDKYGILSPLLTEDTVYNILGYLHGPKGRDRK